MKQNLYEFFQFHYPRDDRYHGNVLMSCKGKKFFDIGFSDINDIVPFIKEKKISRDFNYYITRNSFCNDARHIDSLFTYLNIVIDVDLHCSIYKEIPRQAAYLKGLFTSGDIVMPNSIVYTGRGLQLWYALVPASYKLRKAYDLVTHHLISQIRQALDDCAMTFSVEVDTAASSNHAGLVRLPGSWNTETGTEVTAESLHLERIDLLNFIEEYEVKPVGKPSFKKKPSYEPGDIAGYREALLKKLLDIRGYDQRGYRDLFLFALYASICESCKNPMERVLAFNKLFTVPLSERQVRSYLSSAERKNYHISNQWIIQRLHITLEEQKMLFSSSKKEKKRTFNRMSEEQKDFIRNNLHLSKSQLAKEAGVSVTSVSRFLKKEKLFTEKEQFIRKVRRLLAGGKTTREIAGLLGVSRKKIDHIALTHRKSIEERKEKYRQEERAKREMALWFSFYDEHVHQAIDDYMTCKHLPVVRYLKNYETREMLHDYFNGDTGWLSCVGRKNASKGLIEHKLYGLLYTEIIPSMKREKRKELSKKYGISAMRLARLSKEYDPEEAKKREITSLIERLGNDPNILEKIPLPWGYAKMALLEYQKEKRRKRRKLQQKNQRLRMRRSNF